ncbi:MAG: polyisoprenoid-binding protein [Betaproteobacteria bacterium]|nr:YceI family protein [Betaproteobacteria bacterium]MDE2424007.1 polyisoprenoid-binding protein [Betaproteobacteria bacterium]
MKALYIGALLALASTSVLAADNTYTTDPNHTFVRFSYSHFGYTTQLSRFDTVSGKVEFDPANQTGEANITVDTRSVSTGSKIFNNHIQDADFLDTEKYPTATFKSTKFDFEGDKLSAVEGDLTLKGITKPVTLKVTSLKCMPHPMTKKEACGADATTTLKRTDFNMGKYAPYVGDEVTVSISVEASKK